MNSSEDGFERSLEQIVREAELMLDFPGEESEQSGGCGERGMSVEVIERLNDLEVIAELPGYWCGEITLSLSDTAVEIRTPDFTVKRRLPCPVELTAATPEYRNGVYSLRLMKQP